MQTKASSVYSGLQEHKIIHYPVTTSRKSSGVYSPPTVQPWLVNSFSLRACTKHVGWRRGRGKPGQRQGRTITSTTPPCPSAPHSTHTEDAPKSQPLPGTTQKHGSCQESHSLLHCSKWRQWELPWDRALLVQRSRWIKQCEPWASGCGHLTLWLRRCF